MRALAREGGVLVHVGVKGRDGQSSGDGSLSSTGCVELERWDCEMGDLEKEEVVVMRRKTKRTTEAQMRMSLVLKGE